jgi:Cu+-exporting ATPase
VVTDIVTDGKRGPNDVLKLAAAAESGSEHPLALAILQRAREHRLEVPAVENFNAEPGRGLQATVAGKRVALGSPAFMVEAGINLNGMQESVEALAAQGKTLMIVAVEGQAQGVIAVADAIKTEAAETVAQLKREGLKVFLLTGDNRRSARAVADHLGIDEVLAEVLPADKAAQIRRLQQAGEIVAMVGDGINDAPALAQADVGIAMGTGTDVALETSDITLIKGSLKNVLLAIRLSRRTVSTIKQNLFWAFVYNTVGIPIAAGVLYPFFGIVLQPVYEAAAMALSSVSVVTNSLRLSRAKI